MEYKGTHEELYQEFSKWSPEHASMVIDYKPWGKSSIAIWLNNGHIYKVKYIAEDHFIMQKLSKDDVKRKLGI